VPDGVVNRAPAGSRISVHDKLGAVGETGRRREGEGLLAPGCGRCHPLDRMIYLSCAAEVGMVPLVEEAEEAAGTPAAGTGGASLGRCGSVGPRPLVGLLQ
jgi:hypothetical protein